MSSAEREERCPFWDYQRESILTSSPLSLATGVRKWLPLWSRHLQFSEQPPKCLDARRSSRDYIGQQGWRSEDVVIAEHDDCRGGGATHALLANPGILEEGDYTG